VLQATRHPEVNQENEPRFEPNNQILATALEGCDALAGQLGGYRLGLERAGEACVVDLDLVEPAADEQRLQARANCLDLG
jgi:hypothetical protein